MLGEDFILFYFSSQSQVTEHGFGGTKVTGLKAARHVKPTTRSREKRMHVHVLAFLMLLSSASPLSDVSGPPAQGMMTPTVD